MKYLFVLIAIVVLAVGCKKEKSSPAPIYTYDKFYVYEIDSTLHQVVLVNTENTEFLRIHNFNLSNNSEATFSTTANEFDVCIEIWDDEETLVYENCDISGTAYIKDSTFYDNTQGLDSVHKHGSFQLILHDDLNNVTIPVVTKTDIFSINFYQ